MITSYSREYILKGRHLEVPSEVDDDDVRESRQTRQDAEDWDEESHASWEEFVGQMRQHGQQRQRMSKDEGRYDLNVSHAS
jgi:hypothetical protein